MARIISIIFTFVAFMAMSPNPAFAAEYKVGDYLGFERAVKFHLEVRQICWNQFAQSILENFDKYELSKAAKASRKGGKSGIKMPKESLPVGMVIQGVVKGAKLDENSLPIVDWNNRFMANPKKVAVKDGAVALVVGTEKDSAFAVRMDFSSLDRDAKQVVTFTPMGWNLVGGAKEITFDFTERVSERRTAMLQVLFVDPAHPACN